MKKFLSLAIVVTLLLGLLVPAAAYAKPGNNAPGEKYAIVIGISDYPGELSVLEGGLDLFYSDDDAMVVTGVLMYAYGFQPQNIITLVDGFADRNSILAAIASLQAKVRENDTVIFFYSGHALRLNQLKNNKAQSSVAAIMDCNFEPIFDHELVKAFAKIKTDNIVFIFDTCSSENFSQLTTRSRLFIGATDKDGVSGEIGGAYAPLYGPFLPEEYLFLLYADQGLFTYFFFVLGIGAGYADTDGNGVTLLEAYNFAYGYLYGITLMAQSMGLPLDEVPVMRGGSGNFIP